MKVFFTILYNIFINSEVKYVHKGKDKDVIAWFEKNTWNKHLRSQLELSQRDLWFALSENAAFSPDHILNF